MKKYYLYSENDIEIFHITLDKDQERPRCYGSCPAKYVILRVKSVIEFPNFDKLKYGSCEEYSRKDFEHRGYGGHDYSNGHAGFFWINLLLFNLYMNNIKYKMCKTYFIRDPEEPFFSCVLTQKDNLFTNHNSN